MDNEKKERLVLRFVLVFALTIILFIVFLLLNNQKHEIAELRNTIKTIQWINQQWNNEPCNKEGFTTKYSDGVYHIRVYFDGRGNPNRVIIVDSDKGESWMIK
jgi:hypothetical protein